MSRRGLLFTVLGLALVVAGGLFIVSVFRQSLAPLPAPTPLPPITERVVVTTHNLALGAILQPQDLEQIEVPVDLIPPGAAREAEEIVGRITKIDLITGEMVMTHHLADPTNVNRDLAFVIGENQVLMAFPAEDLLSDINLIQRGDLIDILASLELEVPPSEAELLGGLNQEEDQEPDTKLFTFNALQRVVVQAFVVDIVQSNSTRRTTTVGTAAEEEEEAPQPTPTPSPSQVDPQAILVAVSPQDALVLKHLKDAGAVFDVVLRAPTSTQLFDSLPVSPEYLIDRYGIEIRR